MILYLFYRFFCFLSKILPLKASYAIAIFFSKLKYYLSPRDRCAVINNLKVILPESEHKNINIYAKKVFINFGKYLVEFFRFPLLKKGDLNKTIKISGLENVDNALKKGKGVIILSAHMGNWELGGVFMALLGYPMVAVALPHQDGNVNAFFNRQRQILGMEVVASMGPAIRRIYEALKNNKIIALVGDRDFANGGKRINFLGRSKIIPRGPAFLALKTGAVIVPGFVIRGDEDIYILEFLAPIDTATTEDAITEQCVKVIEEKIRQYPDQWLLFREFWNE